MVEPMPEGLKIRCKIDRVSIEGIIHHEKGRAYICQNEKRGASCSDTLGYRYSRVLDRNDINDPGASVTNIRF